MITGITAFKRVVLARSILIIEETSMNIVGKNRLNIMWVLLVIGITALIASACASSAEARWDGPVTTIYIGHNWPIEMAVHRDDASDLSRVERENMVARRNAERDVLNRMGVRIEWVQYGDLNEEIPNGTSAGQKLDLVRIVGLQQAHLISSNLIQPIDQFAHLFEDDESAWMFWPQVFGNNYFINNILRIGADAPLVYNIGMLNQVPALQEGGRTVLPVHLWQQGRWTWSEFENYLQKVHDHWTAEWEGRMAWGSNHTTAALLAIHSNGGHIYNENGLGFASDEAKEAVAFIDRLMARRLLRNPDIRAGTSVQDDHSDQWRFQWGHSVFASLQQWLAGGMVDSFNERRERMGIVPFPRPDWKDANDPLYRQVNDARDAYGVPFNVDSERAELAIRAFREYTIAYYRRISGSNNALDYVKSDQGLRAAAGRMFIDTANRDYGPAMLEALRYLGSDHQINEYAKNVGIWDFWGTAVLGDSLYHISPASSYETWADQQLPVAQEMIDQVWRDVNPDGPVQ